MNDVREWMRGVEHEDPPDLWSTIQSRVPVRDPSPSDIDPGGQARGWKKMIVIATAAAITVAATGFVIFALRPTAPPHTQGVGQPQRWTFAPQDGWNVSESPLDPRASVLSAWAANVPFDDRDLPHVTGFPLESLRSLPEDGIVVTVLSPNPVASSPQPSESPSTSVPELSLPLHLQDGEVRGPIAEEPRRPLTVYEIRAIVDGDFLLVRTYLGSRNPSADLLASADAAVGRLKLGESVRDVPTPATLGSQQLVVQEGDGTLYLADVDGSRLALLGPGHDPAWSPDGTQLAFREGPQRESGPPTRISVMNADGTGRRDLNVPASVGGEASGETGAPAWSPDGTEIAFASLRGIFVVDADGSNLREVAHYTGTHACYDLEPTWSPDGETIAFAIACDGESEGIWSVPAVGGAPTQLLPVGQEFEDARYPTYSPDGSSIAFSGVRRGSNGFSYGIYVMGADGSNPREAAAPNAAGYPSTWSPDGSRITYTDGKTGQIAIVALRTQEVQKVGIGLDAPCCMSWRG